MELDGFKRCVADELFFLTNSSRPESEIDEVSMTRSRSINRFHRFVARKRRRGLRAVLPHLRPDRLEVVEQLDVSNRLMSRCAEADLKADLASLDEA